MTIMWNTNFAKLFSLKTPIIVAPLGGGPTTPELVAASCNAGALGTLAGAYFQPEQIRSTIEQVRTQTTRPFAVNLFTPMPELHLTVERIKAAIQSTRAYREELGLPEPKVSPPFHPDFEKQFEVLLEMKPAAFSFIFGTLGRTYLNECRKRKILTMGTATTLDEAHEHVECGVNFVIAQGSEAGAHRGLFHPESESNNNGMLSLTQQIVAQLKVPVVAAGGIMNGASIASALSAGAQAVQMGTAFLLCPEAGTSKPYREALLKKGHKPTQITRAFSGRWARGIENRFLLEMKSQSKSILPFPAQNSFTRDLRNESTKMGSADFLSLWAGEGVDLIRPGISAHDLIQTLHAELLAASQI